MIPITQLHAFLRCHAQSRKLEQLSRAAQSLFPSPDENLKSAAFYAADERRRYYFEFLDTAGAGHVANIVLIPTRAKFITLLSNRGGTGDIWEAFLLPISRVEFIALRSKTGRL